MSLACPSCGRTIAIKDAKPGRFRVPCPECGRPFRLEVGEGPKPTMTARPLAPEVPAPATSPMQEARPDPLADARQVGARAAAAMVRRVGWAWRVLVSRRSMVGGTLILQEFGRTSLGSMARGRQVLLGRDVLVRTMPADWGGPDPVSRARAYRLVHVSAEVVHPNLMIRLDFGEERGRRFTIEEDLKGTPLAVRAARDDWPGGPTALACVLHAARGLLAGHEQGLAHGDPSAEQIWLGEDGVVKLAGLGLVQMPGAEARDGAEPFPKSASRDVQNLGRTLDTLSKSRKTDQGVDLPRMREVISRMTAAGTSDGYKDLAEAIAAMEMTLGGLAPTDDDGRRLAEITARYHDVPLALLRRNLVLGFYGLCFVFGLLFGASGRFELAGGVIGLWAMTAVIYGLVRAGLSGRHGLFGKIRELALGGRRADWLTILAAMAGVIVVLFVLGWLAGWIALGLVSTLLAIGFIVAIDAPIERDRVGPLDEARRLLSALRSRGVSELAMREFAIRSGGPRWDELFEALFGLDETRFARAASGNTPSDRARITDWRFPVLDWLDARLRDRREARLRDRFEPVEESALVAQKVNEMTARRKSRRIAEALIVVAREVRSAALARFEPATSDAIRVVHRPIPDLIREAVETPDKLLFSTQSADRGADRGPNPLFRLLAALTGPRARFLLGGVLCALFLLWADQVGVISSTEIREKAERAIAERDVGRLKDVNVEIGRIHTADEPLHIPGMPESLTRLVSGYGVGAAGLILILSALSPGSRIAVFSLPGAAIAWFGPMLGIPPIGPLTSPAVAAGIGAGMLVVGMLWEGRR